MVQHYASGEASQGNTQPYCNFTHFSGLILNANCCALDSNFASFANKTSPERFIQRANISNFLLNSSMYMRIDVLPAFKIDFLSKRKGV